MFIFIRFLPLGRCHCWWTFRPRGYLQPSSQHFSVDRNINYIQFVIFIKLLFAKVWISGKKSNDDLIPGINNLSRIWHNFLVLWVLNALQLYTCLIFNFWYERHWRVLCRRNTRLTYQTINLVPLMTMYGYIVCVSILNITFSKTYLFQATKHLEDCPQKIFVGDKSDTRYPLYWWNVIHDTCTCTYHIDEMLFMIHLHALISYISEMLFMRHILLPIILVKCYSQYTYMYLLHCWNVHDRCTCTYYIVEMVFMINVHAAIVVVVLSFDVFVLLILPFD